MSVNLEIDGDTKRFWEKVDLQLDGCWRWTAALRANGYGHFHVRTESHSYRSELAHRFAYELFVGPIPEGLQIDHLCRNRACVNPEHLEAVTLQENLARGRGAELTRARHRSQTHCKRGHPLQGENVYIIPTTGSRQCRACVQLRKETGHGVS